MRTDKQEVNADAILTADWHLRDDVPLCRTDDYWAAQAHKIRFIAKLQVKHQCPVLLAGDLFDRARPSFFLTRWARINLPKRLIIIPGQHDLPNHSMKLLRDSGLGELLARNADVQIARPEAEKIECTPNNFFVTGFPYGTKFTPNTHKRQASAVLCHTLVSPGKTSIPGTISAEKLRQKLLGFDLIVVGDNHQTFVANTNGANVVSPGSLMRMRADQINHQPCVFLWYAKDNRIEPVYLPIQQGVIDRSHIEEEKARDIRMEEYRARLKAGVKVGVSFERNMEQYLRINRIKDKVAELVYSAMEERK